jgi:GNAT superfamily N-acetyltransferase
VSLGDRGALDWREEPIGRNHDRKAFDCGSPELNDYLRRHARQNHEGGGSKTFAAVSADAPATILGYYSIGPASIEFAKVPAALTKGLGRYEVSVFRLARLAVALSMQGQGLGGDLLLSAEARALAVAAQVGGVALAIDAKDEKAARWYERFGAMPLLDSSPLSLILPFKTIADALEVAQSESSTRPALR